MCDFWYYNCCTCLFTGKTALHWAAAVNNAEATLVLLQHGANRDAQDQKVTSHSAICPSDVM